MPDDEVTPVDTPEARRKSGQHGLDMSDCPKCNGRGWLGPFPQPPSETECDLCLGARKVTLSTATAWLLEQGHALDTPIPDTEPER